MDEETRHRHFVAAVRRGAYPALRKLVETGVRENVPAIVGELNALGMVASRKSVRRACDEMAVTIRSRRRV